MTQFKNNQICKMPKIKQNRFNHFKLLERTLPKKLQSKTNESLRTIELSLVAGNVVLKALFSNNIYMRCVQPREGVKKLSYKAFLLSFYARSGTYFRLLPPLPPPLFSVKEQLATLSGRDRRGKSSKT